MNGPSVPNPPDIPLDLPSPPPTPPEPPPGPPPEPPLDSPPPPPTPPGPPPSPDPDPTITNEPSPTTSDLGTETGSDKPTSCSTTAPPPYTKTISYMSNKDGYTSTEVGDCPNPSGCVSGAQSTTTTVVGTVPYASATTLDEPDDSVPTDFAPLDQDTQQYLKDLFTKNGYASDQNDAKSNCQMAGWTAPQRDSDGTLSVMSKINEWCASVDGKEVTKQPHGVDTLFAMYPISYYSCM